MNEFAIRPPQPDTPSRGLVSLWDMLRFHADVFVQILNSLSRLEAINPTRHHFLDEENKRSFDKDALRLQKILNEVGLEISKRKVTRLMAIVHTAESELFDEGKNAFALQFLAKFDVLRDTIQEELEGRHFYYVNLVPEYLKDGSQPFGDNVATKFSDAIYDIEEAGKCLALERSTACVFHLARAMEVAVQQLGIHLKITNVDKEWGKILSDIKREIEALPKGQKRDEWSENLTLLYHVKQAWRNPTMHPRNQYTPEQAAEIFRAIRSFMRHLTNLI